MNVSEDITFIPPKKDEVVKDKKQQTSKNDDKDVLDKMVGLKLPDEIEQEQSTIVEVKEEPITEDRENKILYLIRCRETYPVEAKAVGLESIDPSRLSNDQLDIKCRVMKKMMDGTCGGSVSGAMLIGGIGLIETAITYSPIGDKIRIGGMSELMASDPVYLAVVKRMSVETTFANVDPKYLLAYSIFSTALMTHKINTKYNTTNLKDARELIAKEAEAEQSKDKLDKLKQMNQPIKPVQSLPISNSQLKPQIFHPQNIPLMPINPPIVKMQ